MKNKVQLLYNTRNLMDFPLFALKETSSLLAAYRNPKLDLTKYLGDVVTPEFNPDSNLTFLIDTNFQIGLLDRAGKLSNWIVCGTCLRENFEKSFIEGANPCCLEQHRMLVKDLRAA